MPLQEKECRSTETGDTPSRADSDCGVSLLRILASGWYRTKVNSATAAGATNDSMALWGPWCLEECVRRPFVHPTYTESLPWVRAPARVMLARAQIIWLVRTFWMNESMPAESARRCHVRKRGVTSPRPASAGKRVHFILEYYAGLGY